MKSAASTAGRNGSSVNLEHTVLEFTRTLFQPVGLLLDPDFHLLRAEGELTAYGYRQPTAGEDCREQLPFLVGLEGETEQALPFLETPNGRSVEVRLRRMADRTRLLLLADVTRFRELTGPTQQRAHEGQISNYRLEQLARQLRNAQAELQRKNRDLRTAAAQLREATLAKSAFLSAMSHEIRTPMNAVIGMTSLLLDTPLTAEQQDCAQTIRASGGHLLMVINKVLDYSKIEMDRLELEQVSFSLRACVKSALDMVAGEAAGKRITIRSDIPSAVPDGLLGDAGRLRQVLLNLLSNSVKFTTEEGRVTVDVALAGSAPGDILTLQIAVRDSGIGLTPEQQARVFQPFSQADRSITRRFGGTGLGLSISRGLVEAMGGAIWVESELGRGATFTFTFKAKAAQAVAAEARGTWRQLASEHPLRILVAEDNAVNRKVAQGLLAKMGYHPDFAVNGNEALAALENQPYDVVFMDVMMPLVGGLEATREICRRWPKGQRPRIVGMSANALQTDRAIGAEAGMDDYLPKPVSGNDLAEALRRCVRRE